MTRNVEMKTLKQPNRINILQSIFDCFQQVTQWNPPSLNFCVEYAIKAASLIELLEVCDCGSIGGHDKNCPLIKGNSWELYRRFLTLIKKYNNEKDIKEVCGFSPNSLQAYFCKLENLREMLK